MSAHRLLVSLDLNKLVHEKARLMILTYLSSNTSPSSSFTELRDALVMSAGNLSIQLKTLEEAGYVTIEKSFKANKPNTAVSLSLEGRKALDHYLSEIETILTATRGSRKETP